MPSRARKAISHQGKVFGAVEGSPELLKLLENAISTPQKATFIRSLLDILPSASETSGDQSGERSDLKLFENFTLTFGTFPSSKTCFPATAAAIQLRKEKIVDTRFKKRRFITEIGLDWTAEFKTEFISKVNSPCQCYLEVLISLID